LQDNFLFLYGDLLDLLVGIEIALVTLFGHLEWSITERNISLILVRFSASESPFLVAMIDSSASS
jgi:hypothetical protein